MSSLKHTKIKKVQNIKNSKFCTSLQRTKSWNKTVVSAQIPIRLYKTLFICLLGHYVYAIIFNIANHFCFRYPEH